MKLLQIDVNCKSGSTGKLAWDIHSKTFEDGLESSICYGRGKQITEKNIYKFAQTFEVYFHVFLTRLTGLTGCFSPIATYNLLNYMKRFKPNVVHIHELHGYFVNILPIIQYLKNKNIKTVWTFHCEFMFTGNCGYAYLCNRWQIGCGKCPNIKIYPKSFFYDWTKKMYNDKKNAFENFHNLTIVTPSHWLAKRVSKSFLKDFPLQIINNGIDIEIFKPRDFTHLLIKHNLNNKKIILCVAPNIMDERKGGHWIVQIAKQLKEENFIFILIGVSDLSYAFENNIIALGRTGNQIELAEYYSLADVFVICSRIENFPTVCLEALACGTPICGFAVGGTAETAPEPFGKFVEYGNVLALSNAVKEMLESPPSVEKCRSFAEKKYSLERMYSEYKKIYFDTVGG